ncbi:acyl-CoA dehydrogenase family protein [Nocardioides caldifontis]|uniref:acyl-CoA dehydrogenase family protein n=1 Tax=Nocardioides caldifontis TaxID=2588938 RepID=UPI0011DF4F3E|nr:acyl-CoA dehydrogenase family protein [Nocardioides caldifontis]
MNDQVAAFAELTTELLVAGQVDDLVAQLADPDLAEEWDDPAVVAAVAEPYGRAAAGGRLLDVAVLRRPDVSLLVPVTGHDPATAARRSTGGLELDGLVRGTVAGTLAVLLDGKVGLVATGTLDVVPVTGLDPAAELRRVRGRVAEPDEQLDVDAATVLSRAARFLAHELLGAGGAALDLAVEHVRSRHQFGVPLGSFQAVRHRLAEAHVQLTAARELLAAIGADADPDVHLLVLKSWAGAAAQTAVAAAQQVCGGMGFTEEFGLHRSVRRAHLLDGLLGGWEEADVLLGRLATEGRVIPDRQVVLS